MVTHQFIRPHTDRAQRLAVDIDLAMAENPEGFTLHVSIRGYDNVILGSDADFHMPTGWAVGGIIPGLRVSTRNPRSYPVLDKFATWSEKYWILRDVLPDVQIYVGGWKDDANFWLDAVLILPDQGQATAFARMKGEKAIGRLHRGRYQETVTV